MSTDPAAMSATRKSDRKKSAATRFEDELVGSSPTKQKAQPSSKKRKAGAVHAAAFRRQRPRRKEDMDQHVDETEADEREQGSLNENTDEEETQELTDKVLRILDVADEDVLVAEHCANDKIMHKKFLTAYAKICGREWTYYVRRTHVTFGRQPDAEQPELETSLAANAKKADVQIDLGPSKTVSRNHAELYFDSTDGMWHVRVLGRNGAKINDSVMKKGEDRAIQSGDVIGIAGTQMLWQAAKGRTVIHQIFLDKVYDQHRTNIDIKPEADGRVEQATNVPSPRNSYPEPLPFGAPQHSPFGQMPIAPAPVGYPHRPITPVTTPRKGPQSSTKKRSPNNRRMGIMMESTEQIDYSADSSRDLKPGCSYASMITWAILSSPNETMSLNNIYDWIKQHYAYYRLVPSGWQVSHRVPRGKALETARADSLENSIRHNLSLNAAFEKVARGPNEPGKGMKWRFVKEKRDEAIGMAQKNASKGGGRTSSAPGSPAGASGMSGGFSQAPPMPNGSPIKMQPQQPGPLMPSFQPSQPPQPQEPGTPTPPQASGPQLPAYAPTQGAFPTLSDPNSPLRQRSSARVPSGIDSSPVLNSNHYHSDYPTNTPAPRAHNLPIPQPNTGRLPSSHMVDSSPAPFWNYPHGWSSTPARPYLESSPAKPNGTATGAASMMNTFQSSSPPPAANGVGAESPTRRTAVHSRPASSSRSATIPLRSASRGLNDNSEQRREVEDDGAIDLVKGFKPIDKFHQERVAGANAAS